MAFDPNNKQHLVSVSGRKFITFVGLQARLVDQKKAIIGTNTEVIQLPTPENARRAIVKVTMHVAQIKDDGTLGVTANLSCVGDADETNVGPAIKDATLRMAETRAQARCLRIATRAEYTAVEEIGQNQDD